MHIPSTAAKLTGHLTLALALLTAGAWTHAAPLDYPSVTGTVAAWQPGAAPTLVGAPAYTAARSGSNFSGSGAAKPALPLAQSSTGALGLSNTTASSGAGGSGGAGGNAILSAGGIDRSATGVNLSATNSAGATVSVILTGSAGQGGAGGKSGDNHSAGAGAA
ncbi:MAG: hypothetical protein LBK71_12190, partial [Verrucomicrobiales bacterium]|nr:hypothetical protein [Verrucomicrobiales bacterium]